MANEVIRGTYNGNPVSMTIDIEDGVEIDQIGESAEWTLTTKDANTPQDVVETDFNGTRPKSKN